MVDGEPIYSISGEVDWEVKQVNMPEGEHELKWVYSKDGASTGGLDKAWLDTIAFASQGVHFADDVGTAYDVPESVR